EHQRVVEFLFSSRRRHTISKRDWSSDVCSSDLDRAKRVDLLLEALAAEPGLRAVIAGDGPDRARLEELARRHGLDGRARFAGRVAPEELAALYARCLAVYYSPVGADYGLVPYE